MTTRQGVGYAVGGFGILWLLATFVLEATLHLRGLPHLPTHFFYAAITVGVGLGWWGFFWADAKRAKDGGSFVLDANDRLHAHRRATDPPVVLPPDGETPP
jgi:hypothetical protein